MNLICTHKREQTIGGFAGRREENRWSLDRFVHILKISKKHTNSFVVKWMRKFLCPKKFPLPDAARDRIWKRGLSATPFMRCRRASGLRSAEFSHSRLQSRVAAAAAQELPDLGIIIFIQHSDVDLGTRGKCDVPDSRLAKDDIIGRSLAGIPSRQCVTGADNCRRIVDGRIHEKGIDLSRYSAEGLWSLPLRSLGYERLRRVTCIL